jgi:hypothetical protein
MGDYDQAVADNSYFYTTWGDNRLGDAFFANQPDVRFAKIPVTGLQTDTVLTAAGSSGGTLTVSPAPATVSVSAGVVSRTGAGTANVVALQGQGSNGETDLLPADQLFALLGNHLGVNTTQIALPGLLAEVSSLESSLLARFDALLSLGFNAPTLNAAQDNWTRDLLFASLSAPNGV